MAVLIASAALALCVSAGQSLLHDHVAAASQSSATNVTTDRLRADVTQISSRVDTLEHTAITRDEYKQGVRDIEQRIDDLRDDLGIGRKRK